MRNPPAHRLRAAGLPPVWAWLSMLLLLLLLCGLCVASAQLGPGRQLLVVESGNAGLYQQVADALERQLRPACRAGTLQCPPQRLILDGLAQTDVAATLARHRADLVVSLGSRAAEAIAVAHLRVPVLYALVPHTLLDRLPDRNPASDDLGMALNRRSALYLKQPPARQLALVRAALPEARRVGVVLGPTSRDCAGPLRAAAAALGLTLHTREISASRELGDVLRELLPRVEVLLAVADPLVHNQDTVVNLLLASYRAGVPVLAYSEAYVAAGALAAVFTTPEQVGTEIGSMLGPVLAHQELRLPPPSYPQRFQVAVNPAVARSLGLELPSTQELERAVRTLAP
jgi:putative ABC transport system substrate-binding protein